MTDVSVNEKIESITKDLINKVNQEEFGKLTQEVLGTITEIDTLKKVITVDFLGDLRTRVTKLESMDSSKGPNTQKQIDTLATAIKAIDSKLTHVANKPQQDQNTAKSDIVELKSFTQSNFNKTYETMDSLREQLDQTKQILSSFQDQFDLLKRGTYLPSRSEPQQYAYPPIQNFPPQKVEPHFYSPQQQRTEMNSTPPNQNYSQFKYTSQEEQYIPFQSQTPMNINQSNPNSNLLEMLSKLSTSKNTLPKPPTKESSTQQSVTVPNTSVTPQSIVASQLSQQLQNPQITHLPGVPLVPTQQLIPSQQHMPYNSRVTINPTNTPFRGNFKSK